MRFKKTITVLLTLSLCGGATFGILYTTSIGARFTINLIKFFYCKELSIYEIKGSIKNGLYLKQVFYPHGNYSINTDQISIYTQFHQLRPIIHVAAKDIVLLNKNSLHPLYVKSDNISAQYASSKLDLLSQKIEGSYRDLPISGRLSFHWDLNHLEFHNTYFYFTDTKISIDYKNSENEWEIQSLPAKKEQINTSGKMNFSSIKNSGKCEVKKFTVLSPTFGSWNLDKAVVIKFSTQAILPITLEITEKSFNSKLFINFEWVKNKILQLNVNSPLCQFKNETIAGNFIAKFSLSQVNKDPLGIKGSLTLEKESHVEFKYHHLAFKQFDIDFNSSAEGARLNIILGNGSKNQLTANINTSDLLFTKPLSETLLEGQLSLDWSDFKFIPTLIPQLSNCQFSVSGKGTIKGTMQDPQINLLTFVSKGKFDIPKQGITIHDLNVKMTSSKNKSTFYGNGFIKNKKFNLWGETSFPMLNTKFKLSGTNLTLYDTEKIQVIATPNLTFNLEYPKLEVSGNVSIPNASISIDNNKKKIISTQDIIFTDGDRPPGLSIVVPQIDLVLQQLKFRGFNLDASVTGKIQIKSRIDDVLSGFGRLTIKEGKYRLQGSTKYIHRGRLLYPAGTLLNDPLMDILITQQRHENSPFEEKMGIYVQGTLQNPKLELYAAQGESQHEIMSKMGLGMQSSTSGSGVLSHSSMLLGGNNNPFNKLLEENLGIDEFDIGSKEIQSGVNSTGGTDTVITVGKSLTDKLFLQYCQNVMEPITTIRLKYFLSSHVATSVESGTEGFGGDLIFTWEKN